MLTKGDVDDILRLIDGSDFQELKLEMGELKLELRRAGAPAAAPATASPSAQSAPRVSAPAPAAVPAAIIASGGGSEVPAPLLGTFWHAPRPGAAPFVAVGDMVTPDTVIGIIEVMKLMNSVPAGMSGKIVEILAPNGELVEHGQPLIRIQPV